MSRLMFGKVLTQHQGSVVLGIVSAIEQGHRALPACSQDRRPGVRLCVQLFPVPSLEFLPAFHLVPEPLAQFGTRRNLLQPRISMQFLLFHATWPEAVHQDALAITSSTRFVAAFDADHLAARSIATSA